MTIRSVGFWRVIIGECGDGIWGGLAKSSRRVVWDVFMEGSGRWWCLRFSCLLSGLRVMAELIQACAHAPRQDEVRVAL